MNRYLPLLAVAALAVAIGAIVALAGNDDKPSSSTSDQSSTSQSTNNNQPTASDEQAATANKVEIENLAFSPQNITVKKGTTVTWTNKDSVDHTVTVDSGDGPKSDSLGRGESYSFTFNEVGEFSYHCIPHPSMTGKVTVTQ